MIHARFKGVNRIPSKVNGLLMKQKLKRRRMVFKSVLEISPKDIKISGFVISNPVE